MMRLCLLSALFLSLQLRAGQSNETISFPKNFFFGVANAPVQVEDQLDNTPWIAWAKTGKVAAFYNHPEPERRIDFWSNPERELDLAQKLGVKVFRLGVSWVRLFPTKETKVAVPSALKRYKEIVKMIKDRHMKVMLTLFHHAEPEWTIKMKSWSRDEIIPYFMRFTRAVVDEFASDVDYWVTFNESNIYVLMTQVNNAWPNYKLRKAPLEMVFGGYTRSLKRMAQAHNQVYAYIKKKAPSALVGVAHNVSNYTGARFISKFFAKFIRKKFNYQFFDYIKNSMDYIGVNYYGAEVIQGLGLALSKNYEYSDSGRAVSPKGLYMVLKDLNARYTTSSGEKFPFIITENGVADEQGWLRPSYLIEHLVALRRAMDEGVKVLGYIEWSLSDNWEWADGYCPKFGLVAVDRANDLKRIIRPSYYLFQRIAKTGVVTNQMRKESWQKVVNHWNKLRPFCRAKDGESSLNEPIMIPTRSIDWRFPNM